MTTELAMFEVALHRAARVKVEADRVNELVQQHPDRTDFRKQLMHFSGELDDRRNEIVALAERYFHPGATLPRLAEGTDPSVPPEMPPQVALTAGDLVPRLGDYGRDVFADLARCVAAQPEHWEYPRSPFVRELRDACPAWLRRLIATEHEVGMLYCRIVHLTRAEAERDEARKLLGEIARALGCLQIDAIPAIEALRGENRRLAAKAGELEAMSLAREAGRVARQHGEAFVKNPYAESDELWQEWRKGWIAANHAQAAHVADAEIARLRREVEDWRRAARTYRAAAPDTVAETQAQEKFLYLLDRADGRAA